MPETSARSLSCKALARSCCQSGMMQKHDSESRSFILEAARDERARLDALPGAQRLRADDDVARDLDLARQPRRGVREPTVQMTMFRRCALRRRHSRRLRDLDAARAALAAAAAVHEDVPAAIELYARAQRDFAQVVARAALDGD